MEERPAGDTQWGFPTAPTLVGLLSSTTSSHMVSTVRKGRECPSAVSLPSLTLPDCPLPGAAPVVIRRWSDVARTG